MSVSRVQCITLLLLCIALCLVGKRSCAFDLKDGDIVFQVSKSAQSLAIQQATGSKYSHMGLILYRNGYPHVFEASGKVRYTSLNDWIRRGQGGRYVVKRLRNADSLLNGESLSKMRRVAEEFRGKPYDSLFEWSDKRIYCSELVWKIYKRTLGIEVGGLQKLKEFNLTAPVVNKLLHQRFGNKIPYNEKVISPAVMFYSKELVPVEIE